MLIVLDNCEYVINAIADIAERLASVDNVTVLATSRLEEAALSELFGYSKHQWPRLTLDDLPVSVYNDARASIAADRLTAYDVAQLAIDTLSPPT